MMTAKRCSKAWFWRMTKSCQRGEVWWRQKLARSQLLLLLDATWTWGAMPEEIVMV